jgi:SAM-dependent methyltransferase
MLLNAHAAVQPSDWIRRWTHLITERSTVLDIACGNGRHLQWFSGKGHQVTGIDRDISAARAASLPVTLIEADIESGPWPLQRDDDVQAFDVVVVTNYLWRPLMPTVLRSVKPGGWLIYETFATGNEEFGKPSRPDFLLQSGELLHMCAGMQIIAYENGMLQGPSRIVQRVVAKHPPEPSDLVASHFRHLL